MSPSRRRTPEDWQPIPLEGPGLPILWQDEGIVVVSKPGGMTVHRERGSRGGERHVLQTLSRQIGQYVYPVHRLDRQTSGVIAFGLNADATRELQDALPEATKQYLVLVRGETPPEFTCDRPLTSEKGVKQEARTEFRTLASFARSSLLRATIRTGRRHQIRRHLSHLAHQVIGDANYGKGRINRYLREEFGLPRMFLHAQRLALVHPTSGAIDVRDPLPADLRDYLGRLPDVDVEALDELMAP